MGVWLAKVAALAPSGWESFGNVATRFTRALAGGLAERGSRKHGLCVDRSVRHERPNCRLAPSADTKRPLIAAQNGAGSSLKPAISTPITVLTTTLSTLGT